MTCWFWSIFIGKKDFLSKSNCDKKNYQNNGSANVKELDDFLQMLYPIKECIPSLPGKLNR